MDNKEIVWCDKPELRITSDVAPCTGVCKPPIFIIFLLQLAFLKKGAYLPPSTST